MLWLNWDLLLRPPEAYTIGHSSSRRQSTGGCSPGSLGVRKLCFYPRACNNLINSLDVNTAAYVAGMASVDWGVANQIMAAANIGTDGQFVATNAQV